MATASLFVFWIMKYWVYSTYVCTHQMTLRHQEVVSGYVSHTRTHKSVAAHAVLLTVFVHLPSLRPLRPRDRHLREGADTAQAKQAKLQECGIAERQSSSPRQAHHSGFCVIRWPHKTGCGVRTRSGVSLQVALLSTSDLVTAWCLFTLQRGLPCTRLYSRWQYHEVFLVYRLTTPPAPPHYTLCTTHQPTQSRAWRHIA